MKILATQYTLQYKSLDIYIAGCKGDNGIHCRNCHNPESWSFENGDLYNKNFLEKILKKIKDFDCLIENIMIFGGEPNDQNYNELENFLRDLKETGKKIWLFTRYKFSDLPQFEYELCDYIKCGEYNENLKTNNNKQHGIQLATSNQRIYKKNIDY